MIEDQQRINTFSKLNTRMRNFEEKLLGLKVHLVTLYLSGMLNHLCSANQQEKEALDDLSVDLELADEEKLVLCAFYTDFRLSANAPAF